MEDDDQVDFQNNNHHIQVCKKRYNLNDDDLVDLVEFDNSKTANPKAERVNLFGKELIIITSQPSEWKKVESEAEKLSDEGKETLENFFYNYGNIEPTKGEVPEDELQAFIDKQKRTLSPQEIIEAIGVIRSKESNKDTFAMPSHSLMFSLLAMFAGKPEQIPRELLEKPDNERTPIEKEQAEKYLNEIFQTDNEYDFSEGKQKVLEKRIVLICNNQKVEGSAEISMSLFRNDLSFREDRLAVYIKRTFGPEGIRHLLGLIIGLEENFRKGHFAWSVNEHLERLGYRKKNRSFDPELRKMASEIIKIFTGLCITSVRKDGKKDSIKAKFLFMVEGFETETFGKEIIDEKINLVATDFWYKNALSSKDGHVPQYTKLLKEIVRENHREHPLTLYLAPLLAIFWRMNPEKKIKVINLMTWCDLETGKYTLRNIRDLESSLEYMKIKGYLGDWKHDGKYTDLSENEDPLNICLTLTPPKWLESELQLIGDKKETFAIENKATSTMLTLEEFTEIFKNSGLTIDQFANHLGVTGRYIRSIKSCERKISKKISQKIQEFDAKWNKK